MSRFVSPDTGVICKNCFSLIDPGVAVEYIYEDGVTCVCKPCKARADKKRYKDNKKAAEKEASKPKPTIVKQLAKAGRIPERNMDECFSKKCSKCRVMKQFTAFYKLKDGRPAHQCKDCHREGVAASAARRKEKSAEKVTYVACRPQIADYLL